VSKCVGSVRVQHFVLHMQRLCCTVHADLQGQDAVL
jgi:hypothetical protein